MAKKSTGRRFLMSKSDIRAREAVFNKSIEEDINQTAVGGRKSARFKTVPRMHAKIKR